MPKEYVAYEGDQFTIEWYYSAKGESQSRQYFLSLDASDRIAGKYLFDLRVGLSR